MTQTLLIDGAWVDGVRLPSRPRIANDTSAGLMPDWQAGCAGDSARRLEDLGSSGWLAYALTAHWWAVSLVAVGATCPPMVVVARAPGAAR